MKQIYFLTTILLLTFINLNAQTVEVSGSDCYVDGTYILSSDINGRASYVRDIYTIQWTGTRWELLYPVTNSVGYTNDSNTLNPPASILSAWTIGLCSTAITVSGDGTSNTTLSINEVEFTIGNIKVYPNPASDYITISELKKVEKYEIYNSIGQKLKKGIISNKEKIDIENLIKGIYFLKLERGNTLKFIKE